MECPICKESMSIKVKDISNDGKGKEYDRIIFWCEKDDAWMRQEIPKGTRPE